MFYGTGTVVRARARKLARQVVRQRDFNLFKGESLLDTTEVPGLIFVEHEDWPRGEANFHCDTLSDALAAMVPVNELHDFMTAWLLWSLEEEWRFVLALGQGTYVALIRRDPSVLLRYVNAGDVYWPALRSVGRRFGPMVDDAPREIWESWRVVKFALAELGVPPSLLDVAPQGGPSEFLKHSAN